MRGANMSVVGRAVVKCLATSATSKCVLGDAFVVRFQVTSKVFLFPKLFATARTFVGFLAGVDALMGC